MLGLALAGSASAETYWLDYEGDALPESCGWTRIWNQPFAERSIQDGVFVLDASADRHTCDWYEHYTDNGCAWPMPDAEVPDPCSHFFMQWRLKIEDFIGSPSAATVGVFTPDSWAVGFLITDQTIRSAFEQDVSASFEPNEFHEFELRSTNMRTYELYMDGSPALTGYFYDAVMTNKIVWGEDTTTGSSVSRWDYFRVGIAPEPCSSLAVIVLMAAASLARRTRG